YVTMAITPLVPKRYFLPVVLFGPLGMLALVPVSIYRFAQAQQVAWILSFLQLLVGLAVVSWMQGRGPWRLPLVREEHLGSRLFSWLNVILFVLVNVVVVVPGVIAYLLICGVLAIDHFSDGFLALHADRLSVCAKHYQRADGKSVH